MSNVCVVFQVMFKCYAAGPFFNPMQLAAMESIEQTIAKFTEFDVYKPRDGSSSARRLNNTIGAGKDPSATVRHAVFIDNITNIDDADLVVALVDDRDVGTVFEMGYACKAGIPVISFTAQGYGMNLMLAESVIAHCKGCDQLAAALELFLIQRVNGQVDVTAFDERFKRANLSEGVEADRSMSLYKQDSK